MRFFLLLSSEFLVTREPGSPCPEPGHLTRQSVEEAHRKLTFPPGPDQPARLLALFYPALAVRDVLRDEYPIPGDQRLQHRIELQTGKSHTHDSDRRPFMLAIEKDDTMSGPGLGQLVIQTQQIGHIHVAFTRDSGKAKSEITR